MDEREQGFVVKFFWLQGLGRKVIHAQLSSILAGTVLSLSTVQRWLSRFKEGITSREDAERPDRPMVITGELVAVYGE
jgi:transposase